MGKRVYKLVLKTSENAPVGRERYVYSYAQTKGITFQVGKKGVSVEALMGFKEEPANLLDKPVFKDAARKALTVYLIKNSKPLRIGCMRQESNGDVIVHRLHGKKDTPPVSTLVVNDLVRPVDDSLKTRVVIEAFLERPKSKEKHLGSSLNANLMSKSKFMESERFIYLWMAFNGMYATFNGGSERGCLTELHKRYGTGTESLTRDDRIKACRTFMWSIESSHMSHDEFLADAAEVIKGCKPALNAGLTAEGFIMVELGYYLRCNVFHASEPVLFVADENDVNLGILRHVNNLLEGFIDDNLADWYVRGEENDER